MLDVPSESYTQSHRIGGIVESFDGVSGTSQTVSVGQLCGEAGMRELNYSDRSATINLSESGNSWSTVVNAFEGQGVSENRVVGDSISVTRLDVTLLLRPRMLFKEPEGQGNPLYPGYPGSLPLFHDFTAIPLEKRRYANIKPKFPLRVVVGVDRRPLTYPLVSTMFNGPNTYLRWRDPEYADNFDVLYDRIFPCEVKKIRETCFAPDVGGEMIDICPAWFSVNGSVSVSVEFEEPLVCGYQYLTFPTPLLSIKTNGLFVAVFWDSEFFIKDFPSIDEVPDDHGVAMYADLTARFYFHSN